MLKSLETRVTSPIHCQQIYKPGQNRRNLQKTFYLQYSGGQSSDSVRDDRELTLLTESEFCPPEHQ